VVTKSITVGPKQLLSSSFTKCVFLKHFQTAESSILVSWPLLGREGWREAAYGLIYQREVLSFKKGVGAG